MLKTCSICGKRSIAGKSVARPWLPKKGAMGLKSGSVSNRHLLPNMQIVKVIQNGTVGHTKVCAKCLKAGKVVKA